MIHSHDSFSCTVRWQIPNLDCLTFGHVFAPFGFTIVARARFPILSAFDVDPDLAGKLLYPPKHGAKSAPIEVDSD